MPVFTRTEVPPLVCTCVAVADQTRSGLAGLAEVVECSADDPDRVDEAAVLAALADRGLFRVLTEGGPHAVQFVRRARPARRTVPDDRAEPGRRSGRPHHHGPGKVLTEMRRAHILTDEGGYLYTRYVKA